MTPIILDPLASPGLTGLALDPDEVAVDRTELAINADSIRVADPGPDWGDAAIQAFLADQAVGETPVGYRIPNRQVKIPLILGADGPSGYATARDQLRQKVGLFQREGGWLRRGTDRYCDVVNATLTYPDRWGHLGVEGDVVLTLECLPEFYGDEVDLGDNVETTNTTLIWTETGIDGDMPGRLRIVVDNDEASQKARGALVALRSRHYDNAATAALHYEAEALTPISPAAVSGSAVRHQTVPNSWTPILTTTLSGNDLTHTGSYRVWARAQWAGTSPPYLRAVWDVGDPVAPVENVPVLLPSVASVYTLVDLGEVRIDETIGTHYWRGMIQAKGQANTTDLYVDELLLVPLDEGAVKLSCSNQSADGMVALSARDQFQQSAGDLGDKSLEVGGDWDVAGHATGFAMDATNHWVTRSFDTGDTGHFALAGTTVYDDVVVQADVVALPTGAVCMSGVFARYSGTADHVRAVVITDSAGNPQLQVVKAVTGVGETVLGQADAGASGWPMWKTVRLMVDTEGNWTAQAAPQYSSAWTVQLSGTDTALAAGQALDDGKIGLYDKFVSGGSALREVDNFQAYVPAYDAVCFNDGSLEVGTNGNFREDAGVAGSWGRVARQSGDLLRIPSSGVEERTVQFMVRLSTGDLADLRDAAALDTSARAYYRPCWLFPED